MLQRIIRVRARHNRLLTPLKHSLIRHPTELPHPISTRLLRGAHRHTHTLILSRINRQTYKHHRHRHSSHTTGLVSLSTMSRARISSISTRLQISSLVRNLLRVLNNNATSVISNLRQGIVLTTILTVLTLTLQVTTTHTRLSTTVTFKNEATIKRPDHGLQVHRRTTHHLLITRGLTRQVRCKDLQLEGRVITRVSPIIGHRAIGSEMRLKPLS